MQESSVLNTPPVPGASDLLSLPSHLFFVRSVPLPAGLSPDEVASFVEVSLEEISPFTLNQLYYGYYFPPGAETLLIFAAYRKQLAVYQDDDWANAEVVLPDFVSVLGMERSGPTLVFLQDEHDVTAIYWPAKSRVPERVLSRTIDPEAEGEAGLDGVREELRRKLAPLPEEVKLLTLEKQGEGVLRDKALVFKLREDGGKEVSAEIGGSELWAMDVRDKDFLRATRKERRHNRWLWAGVLLIFAGFITLGVFEVALYAGGKILENREERVRALEPEVAQIMEEEELANRLEELSGERLLPFEMLGFLNDIRPRSIYFTSVSTDGLRSFRIEALTPRSQDVDRYQQLLEQNDSLENVEIVGLRTRPDGRTSFSIDGTFAQGAIENLSTDGTATASTDSPPAVSAERGGQDNGETGGREAARSRRGEAAEPTRQTVRRDAEI